MGTDYTTASPTLNAWGAFSGGDSRKDMTSTWYTTNDATFELTGLQLEVGSQATPFEHRSYQEELHLCKRYYQRYPEGPTADNYNCVPSAIMACNNTTTAYYCPTLNPTMRSSPSFSTSGNFRMNGTASVNNVAVTAMQVAQRATSSTSGGYVSLDRWYVNLSGGSATFSQETNSNPSETGGIQKYARYNVSTSSDYTHIRQRIEDVTSVPAGTVIISFYAKGTAPSGGLYASTEQSFGSGGSSSVDGTPVLVTSSLTSSWVRYTAQITVGSVDGKTIGAGSYFGVAIGQYSNTGGTAYDLNITGVQLEVGTQATDFEHRSYGEELSTLC